jgi:hypothetical protein
MQDLSTSVLTFSQGPRPSELKNYERTILYFYGAAYHVSVKENSFVIAKTGTLPDSTTNTKQSIAREKASWIIASRGTNCRKSHN